MQTYLQVGDPGLGLASVTVAIRGGGGRGQIIGGNAPRVPVCPVNAVRLDVQVHGVNAHIGVALEDLLITPVWHGRVQAADLIVVSNIQHLSLSWLMHGKQNRRRTNRSRQYIEKMKAG